MTLTTSDDQTIPSWSKHRDDFGPTTGYWPRLIWEGGISRGILCDYRDVVFAINLIKLADDNDTAL
jgi:hypothetical protein